MNLLITGCSGFVGSYLAEHLLAQNHTIHGTDRVEQNVSGVHMHVLDIRNAEAVVTLVQDIRPDYVYHLAGFSSVRESWLHPDEAQSVNVGGTKNVLDALLHVPPLKKVLVISSGEVYGSPKNNPVSEQDALEPLSPYAQSRVEQETLCATYMDRLPIIISRSFNHTGPGQTHAMVCGSITKQVADMITQDKERILHIRDASVRRDFSDVRDVVRAYSMAMEHCPAGLTFNTCSGRAYSIRDIIDMAIAHVPGKVLIDEQKDAQRKTDIPLLYGSHALLTQHTGWQPIIPFEKTIADMIAYWVERV
ncbi:MAG: GDP-mannose 4,6-dehydratase [archaeon]